MIAELAIERRERLVVAPCPVEEIMAAREFPALVEEYAAESAVAGLPPPDAKMDTYAHLEMVGLLHSFSAMVGSNLVGFIGILTPVLPHYGITFAVGESFFVASAHRKSGAGLRLLRAAESMAWDLGSPGLFMSAPVNGILAELLPKCGYAETNRTFLKLAPRCLN